MWLFTRVSLPSSSSWVSLEVGLAVVVVDSTEDDVLDGAVVDDDVSVSPPSVVLTEVVSVTVGESPASSPDPQAVAPTSSSAAAQDVIAVRYMAISPSSRPPVASPP